METIVRKEWGSPKGNVQEFTPQEFVAQCEQPVPGVQMVAYWDVVDTHSGYNNRVVQDGLADNFCDVTYERIESDGKLEVTGARNIGNGWYFNKTIYSGNPANSQYFNTNAFHVVTGYENATVYVQFHRAWIFKEKPSDDIIGKGTSYTPDPSESGHTKIFS